MSSEYQYEKLYYALLTDLEKMHKQNVKRTRSTLRALIIVPTVFLILLFLSNSQEFKTIFLALWIVSMFVIAAILIVIEYQDYQLKNIFTGLNDVELSEEEASELGYMTQDQLDEAKRELDEAKKQLEQFEDLKEDIRTLSKEDAKTDDVPAESEESPEKTIVTES